MTFQLKRHPTFVSDAMESDLLETVQFFGGLDEGAHPNCVAASKRWTEFLERGDWLCEEDFYWVQVSASRVE